jgi:3-oxoacyl-(acyl-carrier-protein) synthase
MPALDRDDDHRIVVTGLGVVTTIGETPAEYCDSLMAGRSGITRWKSMDERIYSKIGGDLSDFDLRAHLSRVGAHYPSDRVAQALRLLRVTPLPGRLTTAAALQAFTDAGLPDSDLVPERFGHVLAGHNLNSVYIGENVLTLREEPEFIDPLYSLMSLDTDVLSVASELLHCKGPSFTVGGACASGNVALLCGLDLLRSGRAGVMLITGGSVALDPVMLQSWAIVDAISIRSFNDEPARASRPWDVRREGFVPSEGTGAVILETLAGARARGARVYAELLGGGSASDASRLPKPYAEGQARAMRLALDDARVPPDQIDYINSHATATVLGDVVEVDAIKAVFGDRARRIPVNSTKSMIGHCLTSASVVEFVATILQMQHGFLHPTLNLEEPEPGLDLDFVPHEARPHRIDMAISNSFGFGGINTAVVVGRAP